MVARMSSKIRLTMILSEKPLRWKKKVTKATTMITRVSMKVDTMWKPIWKFVTSPVLKSQGTDFILIGSLHH